MAWPLCYRSSLIVFCMAHPTIILKLNFKLLSPLLDELQLPPDRDRQTDRHLYVHTHIFFPYMDGQGKFIYNSKHKRPSSKPITFSDSLEISCIKMEPWGSLLCSQKPTSSPYPKSHESTYSSYVHYNSLFYMMLDIFTPVTKLSNEYKCSEIWGSCSGNNKDYCLLRCNAM